MTGRRMESRQTERPENGSWRVRAMGPPSALRGRAVEGAATRYARLSPGSILPSEAPGTKKKRAGGSLRPEAGLPARTAERAMRRRGCRMRSSSLKMCCRNGLTTTQPDAGGRGCADCAVRGSSGEARARRSTHAQTDPTTPRGCRRRHPHNGGVQRRRSGFRESSRCGEGGRSHPERRWAHGSAGTYAWCRKRKSGGYGGRWCSWVWRFRMQKAAAPSGGGG